MSEVKVEALSSKESNEPGRGSPSAARTILIIDHNEQARKSLAYQLSEAYQVIESGTPEEALGLALRHKPDAILLDVTMPLASGFEICQGLSSLSFTELIPIFVISNEPAGQFSTFCESLGAKGYFQKPVDMAALQKRLASAIDRNFRERRLEPRVRLRVMLKLQGIDSHGDGFDLVTTTENVSAHGFSCACAPSLQEGAIVSVSLARNSGEVIARARVVGHEWPGTAGQKCGFLFLEKPSAWILN